MCDECLFLENAWRTWQREESYQRTRRLNILFREFGPLSRRLDDVLFVTVQTLPKRPHETQKEYDQRSEKWLQYITDQVKDSVNTGVCAAFDTIRFDYGPRLKQLSVDSKFDGFFSAHETNELLSPILARRFERVTEPSLTDQAWSGGYWKCNLTTLESALQAGRDMEVVRVTSEEEEKKP